MNSRLEELLLAHEDDALSPAEKAELAALLSSDPAARQRLVESTVLRSVARDHEFRAERIIVQPSRWRPYLAAAAGIVIGCFSTSLLLAFQSGISRVLLPLANASFESPEEVVPMHVAKQAGQWSGVNAGIVIGGKDLPLAKDGQRMIRNGPAGAGKGCFASTMVDISSSRPETSSPLQIEVTAHYHASKPGLNEHYSMNVSTFAEEPAAVSSLWETTYQSVREASLTTIGKAIFPTKDQPGWHHITVRVDVPPQARTLLITLGSNTPGHVQDRTDHYMDDIHASWLILDSNRTLP
jgi:hypothetical protein